MHRVSEQGNKIRPQNNSLVKQVFCVGKSKGSYMSALYALKYQEVASYAVIELWLILIEL